MSLRTLGTGYPCTGIPSNPTDRSHQSTVQQERHREPWIAPAIVTDVHRYLGGIVRNERAVPMIVNGAVDHVHLLVRTHQNTAISSFLRVIKAKSSGWIHVPRVRGLILGWEYERPPD